MSFAVLTNWLLRKVGIQVVRTGSLERLVHTDALDRRIRADALDRLLQPPPVNDPKKAALRVLTGVADNDLDLAPAIRVVLKDLSVTAQLMAAATSVKWLHANADRASPHNSRQHVIDAVVKQLPAMGDVVEFGVFTGAVTHYIHAQVPERQYHAFDSFRGVPEAMSLSMDKFGFDLGGTIPELPPGVIVHDGWFSDTMPVYRERYQTPIALAYIDCDLYQSVKTVLEGIHDRLQNGTILIFDDWYNFPNWRLHSYKALTELSADTSFKFVPISFSLRDHAVAFRCDRLQ